MWVAAPILHTVLGVFRFLKRDRHADEWGATGTEMMRVMMKRLDTVGPDASISSDIASAGEHSDQFTILGARMFKVSSVMTFSATRNNDDLYRYLSQRIAPEVLNRVQCKDEVVRF